MVIGCQEAYDQALDLEHKNQITRRYEMSTQVHQIAECGLEEEFEGVGVMELCPHGENTGSTLNKNNRVQRNFNQPSSGISTEKGKMIVTTEDQLLRTATELLEGEPTEISVPNITRTPNLPNGMHNSKPTVLMVKQY